MTETTPDDPRRGVAEALLDWPLYITEDHGVNLPDPEGSATRALFPDPVPYGLGTQVTAEQLRSTGELAARIGAAKERARRGC